jgi:hypothetical protein
MRLSLAPGPGPMPDLTIELRAASGVTGWSF